MYDWKAVRPAALAVRHGLEVQVGIDWVEKRSEA
jgi:hypothetical protein